MPFYGIFPANDMLGSGKVVLVGHAVLAERLGRMPRLQRRWEMLSIRGLRWMPAIRGSWCMLPLMIGVGRMPLVQEVGLVPDQRVGAFAHPVWPVAHATIASIVVDAAGDGLGQDSACVAFWRSRRPTSAAADAALRPQDRANFETAWPLNSWCHQLGRRGY